MPGPNSRKRHPLARTIALAIATAPLALQAPNALAQDVDFGNLGERGFRIVGSDAGDRSGVSVSGAGDVNGDGLADLIVGADSADPAKHLFAVTELKLDATALGIKKVEMSERGGRVQF
jgi:hypothetical protein